MADKELRKVTKHGVVAMCEKAGRMRSLTVGEVFNFTKPIHPAHLKRTEPVGQTMAHGVEEDAELVQEPPQEPQVGATDEGDGLDWSFTEKPEDEWTVAQMKQYLDSHGVEYAKKATKDDLLELVLAVED